MIVFQKCFLRVIILSLNCLVTFGQQSDSDSVKVVSETDNKAKVSTNSTDSRVFRDTQLQRCVTREGRPGYCKAGVCLNLIDKKPVYCPSSSSYYMKCCPINNRAAVLPSNEPSMQSNLK